MNLFTSIDIPKHLPCISQKDSVMMLGSCFVSEIGKKLNAAKFRCDINPYGTLYNPLSIATALREIIIGKEYTEKDLFEYQGFWHSGMHHGDFSKQTVEETLQAINGRIEKAHKHLRDLKVLFLTFGTSYVYREMENGRVVGNCHKLPESHFMRYRLTIDEIVDTYTTLAGTLLKMNPELKFVFTVSPIRHIRDGLHENQLSKATLLLAIDVLQTSFPQTMFYFPAYEILQDELRDYRFYAEDLVHPSGLAIDYIWERFTKACMKPDTLQVVHACELLNKSLEHRPLRPDSEEYKRFIEQIVSKINQLNAKHPYLDFQKELELCRIRLSK